MSIEIKKYDYIDALRGIAVLGTLMVHSSQQGLHDYPEGVMKFVMSGGLGVQLFFVMSALTLFMSMNKRKVEEKRPITNFFIRRFFRIAPLFYLAVLYSLYETDWCGRYWLGDSLCINGWNIAATMSFTNSFNPYWINSIVEGGWSIAIEMLFYVCLPVIFLMVKSLKQALYFLAFSLIFLSLMQFAFGDNSLISDTELWSKYLYFWFPAQLPVFALGITLYYLLMPSTEDYSIRHLSSPLLLLSGLFMLQIIYNLFAGHIMMSIGFVALALVLAANPIRLLVNPVTTFIGKISFSMYLIHFPVLHWMHKMGYIDIFAQPLLNFGCRYSILIAVATLISYLTYKFIEVPGQNLGKAFIARLEA